MNAIYAAGQPVTLPLKNVAAAERGLAAADSGFARTKCLPCRRRGAIGDAALRVLGRALSSCPPQPHDSLLKACASSI
jgi:hypothetical protein